MNVCQSKRMCPSNTNSRYLPMGIADVTPPLLAHHRSLSHEVHDSRCPVLFHSPVLWYNEVLLYIHHFRKSRAQFSSTWPGRPAQLVAPVNAQSDYSTYGGLSTCNHEEPTVYVLTKECFLALVEVSTLTCWLVILMKVFSSILALLIKIALF